MPNPLTAAGDNSGLEQVSHRILSISIHLHDSGSEVLGPGGGERLPGAAGEGQQGAEGRARPGAGGLALISGLPVLSKRGKEASLHIIMSTLALHDLEPRQ